MNSVKTRLVAASTSVVPSTSKENADISDCATPTCRSESKIQNLYKIMFDSDETSTEEEINSEDSDSDCDCETGGREEVLDLGEPRGYRIIDVELLSQGRT